VAVQSSGQQPTLQITNLHGDVIAEVEDSPTATWPSPTRETDEFGAPAASAPEPFAWLGAAQRPNLLNGAAVGMGARTYVPELGRFLEPDPVPGGSANAYDYAFQDPVNQSDPAGTYTVATPDWVYGWLDATAKQAVADYEAEQARIKAEADAAAAAAAAAAAQADYDTRLALFYAEILRIQGVEARLWANVVETWDWPASKLRMYNGRPPAYSLPCSPSRQRHNRALQQYCSYAADHAWVSPLYWEYSDLPEH
jgi:RHS repeat-associated protein